MSEQVRKLDSVNDLVNYRSSQSEESSADEGDRHQDLDQTASVLIQKSPRKRRRNRKSIEIDDFNEPLDITTGSLDVQTLLGANFDWLTPLKSAVEQFDDKTETENLEKTDQEFSLDLSTLELTQVVKHRRLNADLLDEQKEAPPSTSSTNHQEQEQEQEQEQDPDFKTPKPRCRKFIFKPFIRNALDGGSLEHDESKEPVEVVIPEQLAASFGLYLWPSAPVLAWYLWLHQADIQGKKVLELGSGTALPGLLCAKFGAEQVWLSDDSWQPKTLENIREAIKINGLETKAQVKGLTWGDYTDDLFDLCDTKVDFIIGSDIFFDPEVFEPLLITISFLLESNPNTQVLIAVQDRSSDWSIEEFLLKWKLNCFYIWPREFLRGTGIEEGDLTGKHSIFILKIFPQQQHQENL
jgi:predicted nicotinamide N-methyase